MTEPARLEILAAVQTAIGEILEDREPDLDPSTITEDARVYADEDGATSLGLDSLDAFDLINTLEEQFDIELPPGFDVELLGTVGSIVTVIIDLSTTTS